MKHHSWLTGSKYAVPLLGTLFGTFFIYYGGKMQSAELGQAWAWWVVSGMFTVALSFYLFKLVVVSEHLGQIINISDLPAGEQFVVVNDFVRSSGSGHMRVRSFPKGRFAAMFSPPRYYMVGYTGRQIRFDKFLHKGDGVLSPLKGAHRIDQRQKRAVLVDISSKRTGTR